MPQDFVGALFYLILLTLSPSEVTPSPAQGGQWTCQPEYWVTPTTVSDGLFDGTLASDCTLEGTAGGGIAGLNGYLLSQVGHGETINEGPFPETYSGLPGVRYDVTIEADNDGDTLTVRADTHYATDGKNRLIYASDSKEVDGSGAASYLRKITESAEVVPAKGLTYKMHVTSSLQVDKPWYAPEGVFKSRTEQAFIQNFKLQRDQRIPDWAAHL